MSDTTVVPAAPTVESLFDTLKADGMAAWGKFETVVVDDAEIVINAVKSFVTAAAPSALADIVQFGVYCLEESPELITDPAAFITAILNKGEALGEAWWTSMQPAVQTALATTAAGIAATNKAILAPAAGSTGATGA